MILFASGTYYSLIFIVNVVVPAGSMLTRHSCQSFVRVPSMAAWQLRNTYKHWASEGLHAIEVYLERDLSVSLQGGACFVEIGTHIPRD